MIFATRTGKLLIHGELAGIGYSGKTDAANDPTRVAERDKGPIPPGRYTIRQAAPAEVAAKKLGPCWFWLAALPDAGEDPSKPLAHMHGREGFLIHWDNFAGDFTASEGCLIFWLLVVFQRIAEAVSKGDDILTVI